MSPPISFQNGPWPTFSIDDVDLAVFGMEVHADWTKETFEKRLRKCLKPRASDMVRRKNAKLPPRNLTIEPA
jgi:hypothetical protein